ncbi:MAG: hypothetical protein COB24_00690 [Hyphomicrobiales bacterium]|nr:MAG: hypothetical protein COB24_00690 [Hyphomicrobiales bacterium]
MCGRFTLIADVDYIAELFEVVGAMNISDDYSRPAVQMPARFNIAPSQPVLIIKNQIDVVQKLKNTPNMQLAQWGFIADWMKQPPRSLIINARSETALVKPMFRGAIEQNRCIIPASGWYEWKTIKGVKQPFYMSRDMNKTNNSLLAFAGLYSRFMAADGSEIDTIAIMTKPAVGMLKQVHDRMPCLLPQDNFKHWLDGWNVRGRNALELFDDNEVENLKMHAVSREVGNSRIDRDYFINEVELEQPVIKKPEPKAQLSLF